MSHYITFTLMGAWQGSVSILLCVIGIMLITLPYLVQPVMGFKMRSMIGSTLVILGILGFVKTASLANQEISADKYIQLTLQATHNKTAQEIFNSHLQGRAITNMEYYQLQRTIKQQKMFGPHPPRKRHLSSE